MDTCAQQIGDGRWTLVWMQETVKLNQKKYFMTNSEWSVCT